MSDSNQLETNSGEGNVDDTRQLLELELQKIRSQAQAARLDAKAAEIEIVMQRLRASRGSDEQTDSEVVNSDWAGQRLRMDIPASSDGPRDGDRDDNGDDAQIAAEASELKPLHRFANWNDLRTAQIASGALVSIAGNREGSADQLSDHVDQLSSSTSDQSPILRFDAPHGLQPSHIGNIVDEDSAIEDVEENVDVDGEADEASSNDSVSPSLFVTDDVPKPTLDIASLEFAGNLTDAWGDDEEPEPQKRGKSAAVFVSALVHVAVLFSLGTVGLQIHRPKDQVALSASASSGEEAAMESFSIEAIDQPEPETEVTEPTPAETEYEVSPIGNFKAADFATDAIVSPVSSMVAAMTSQSDVTDTIKMLESDSISKMKFCGVEGGGNHFVYLVDSSGSMGDAFESARRALLASIDLLSPDQRFYVVFFDSQSDFMRISNAGVDESRSVYATAKNKAALRRWAMRIKMDRGKAPYDPLKFALGLKADVIFLLSDGEFPEGIPKLLKEENRIENLFGESKPISIVHTISYHSKEGASIMTRIAKQNGGQYRHVPKP